MHEDKKKCVWMTSGLIAYKLCAHDYLCEECMFDRAMRNEPAVTGTWQNADTVPVKNAVSINNEPSMRIMEDFFYHKHHCWARVENSEYVRIGINGLLAKLITGIKTLVLPKTGDTVNQGRCFSHVIMHRLIVPLISPLSGSIHSVNHELAEKPELLVDDFWESGWLVTIKPDNLEQDLQTLIFGKKAAEWHKTKEQKITQISRSMLTGDEQSPGPTMQDGGEIITTLADILTSEQYYKILESLSDDAEDEIVT